MWFSYNLLVQTVSQAYRLVRIIICASTAAGVSSPTWTSGDKQLCTKLKIYLNHQVITNSNTQSPWQHTINSLTHRQASYQLTITIITINNNKDLSSIEQNRSSNEHLDSNMENGSKDQCISLCTWDHIPCYPHMYMMLWILILCTWDHTPSYAHDPHMLWTLTKHIKLYLILVTSPVSIDGCVINLEITLV